MKRLFFSVLVLTLGAFAFMSCDDEEKIKNEGKDGGKYMTVPEQQQAITGALDGVAEAIEFTEFSNALGFVQEILGREINPKDLIQILASPAIQEDTVFQNKLSKAMIMFSQDTITIDLSPLYMSADLFIRDTVLIDTIRYYGEGGSTGSYVDTTYQTLFVLDNIKHDVDCFQLNVFVDNHELTLKAKVRAGESIITYKSEKTNKTVYLPKSAEVSLSLDGKVLAAINGEYTSDMSLYVEDIKDGDDIVEFDGTKFSVSGSIKVVSYELAGSVKFDMSKGAEANMAVKYADNAILSINGKLDAVFEGLDLDDSTAILIWAQNPEKLKSISLDASLGGGKVKMKGSIENPFKDEELATTLRSLMVPGATISKEKGEKAIERLNGVISGGIYFEGFNEPQAKLKLIYRERPTGSKGGDYDDDEDGESPIDAIGELFDRLGAYPVFVVRDADGKEATVPCEEYFEGIDVSNFTKVVKGKFMDTFGPIINQIEEMNHRK